MNAFLNDNKDKSRFSKNYFFVCTAALIVLNALLFIFGGSGWHTFIDGFESYAYFYRIIRSCLNCFTYVSARTLALDMLLFAVCGLYLERKTGSTKLLLIISALTFLTATATTANFFSLEWQGFSIVVYGLSAYIIVEYLFSLPKKGKSRLTVILGASAIAIMYIAMSLDGTVFWGYPHDLIFDLGHFAGFITGIIFGLTIQLSMLESKLKEPKEGARHPLKKLLNEPADKNLFGSNYFFAGTIAVILSIVLLYSFGGSSWQYSVKVNAPADWQRPFYFNPIVRACLNTFAHLNWTHVLNNARAMLVCGLYLERKTGSCKFLLMILALTFFTSAVSTASTFSVDWVGLSGIVYLLFAYVLVDYAFSMFKSKRSLPNIIFGAAVLIIIYVFMCGGLSFDPSREIKWYPYILMYHSGHLSGFISGLVFGIAVQIIKLIDRKEKAVKIKA